MEFFKGELMTLCGALTKLQFTVGMVSEIDLFAQSKCYSVICKILCVSRNQHKNITSNNLISTSIRTVNPVLKNYRKFLIYWEFPFQTIFLSRDKQLLVFYLSYRKAILYIISTKQQTLYFIKVCLFSTEFERVDR